MSKIMLVNVTHVEESRVAVVEDGILAAYEIETINRTLIKGNIYNAVVENVHPSLEAAFLKIETDRNGFLPLDGVNFNLLPAQGDKGRSGRIGQHLHTGQRLMAQVVRESFAGKPPSVSTYFSLPGRFLVLMPGVDDSGVSRKIEDSKQRDRLKKIVSDLRIPDGFGVIVRTAGLGQTKLELQRDLRYLLRLWQSIQKASAAAEFPAPVYREADLVIRTIRDHLEADVDEVWIDSEETYEKALAFVTDVMPNRAKTLRLYTGDRPLFNKFNLEEQIESIYKRRVTLPSGGEIVIDGTEALTAVDVNTARSRRKGDSEETALQTNLEAAAETARQLRLRDLGGLVVIDFIDMMTAKNNKKVEEAMRAAMKGDRAKYDMTRLSKMGLMEIARQRLKSAKMSALYATCPTCEGYGLIRNVEAAALTALRKLQTRSARSDIGRIHLRLAPDIATWILNHKREDLLHLEQRNSMKVEIEPRPGMLRHESEFETFPREATQELPTDTAREVAVQPGSSTPATVTPPATDSAAAAPAAPPTTEVKSDATDQSETTAPRADEPPKRRRRRRRSRSESESETTDVAATAAQPEVAATGTDENSAEAKSDDEGAAPKATGGEGEPAPRRRRRRRRRPRSSEEGSGGESTEPAASAGNARAASDEPADRLVIPAGVRADELMPAAAAGSRRRGGARRRR